MGLPNNMFVSVRRSAQIPLLKVLSRLHPVLHMAALHAACPDIAADHFLLLMHMKCVFSQQDAEALGPYPASLSSLYHLNLCRNRIGSEAARALGPFPANFLALQHFAIR